MAFLAYCLQVAVKASLRTLAGGLTPRQALGKFKTLQMADVQIPTTATRTPATRSSLNEPGHGP